MGVIMKRVSVDKRSERIPSPHGNWEDSSSHHTASEASDNGSYDVEGNWTCADDNENLHGLTEEQVRKLRKKGINPALYVEMQAAKKGRSKLLGPLVGNGFLS